MLLYLFVKKVESHLVSTSQSLAFRLDVNKLPFPEYSKQMLLTYKLVHNNF